MKIAVTYEKEQIFQHFGHAEFFKVYDITDGQVLQKTVVDTKGSGHGALVGVLKDINASVLICGGIGGGAQRALAEAGIKLYGGCSGRCDDAVNSFLAGELDYNPDVRCDHHDENHQEKHNCADHGCGGNHSGGHSCH